MGLIVNVLKSSGEAEERTLVGVTAELKDVCREQSKMWMLGRIEELYTTCKFEASPERPAVLLGVGPIGTLAAYDAILGSDGWYRERRSTMNGPMANGRFIWASDSRFPAGVPVRYFDRWE